MSCRRWDGCDDFRYSAHYESDYATYVLNPHSLIEAPLRGTAFPFPRNNLPHGISMKGDEALGLTGPSTRL